MRDRCLALLLVAALGLGVCGSVRAAPPQPSASPVSDLPLDIEPARNDTGGALPPGLATTLTQGLTARLTTRGLDVTGAARDAATLRVSIVRYETGPGDAVVVKAALVDTQNKRQIVDFIAVASRRPAASDAVAVDAAATVLADAIARHVGPRPAAAETLQGGADRYAIGGSTLAHRGDGVFVAAGSGEATETGSVIDLTRIAHVHGLADDDVPPFTNVTLNDRVPALRDDRGRRYALITLYTVDPPLDNLWSAEPGIDRGTDFRDPANLVKGTYSNYVSPVFTLTERQMPVAGHPIGHFLVKLQIPGYPTLLTGMTTTRRVDDELVDLTLGRQLGIGGVLLTPQPGRLNSAAEALEELSRRQHALLVIDGRHYRNVGGKNVGPTYVVEDGNVTFARFKLPQENAKDALRFFLEYVDRGVHNTFGSLVDRPHKGTGAGCAAFAFAWLKAAGIVPFVDETAFDAALTDEAHAAAGTVPFWARSYRRVNVPWPHIGCDDRLGVAEPQPADYTIYDLLFYGESRADIVAASQGLAAKIREDVGVLGATLFQFGAFTPLRDLVIRSRRKDPDNLGDYAWAPPGRGLEVGLWDNRLFSDWVKGHWRRRLNPADVRLAREGRFHGVEIDAMGTPRQTEAFYRRADEIDARRRRHAAAGIRPSSCEAAFALGVH